jgi:hypothetical protein
VVLAVERNTVNSCHKGAAGSLADRIGIQEKEMSKENTNEGKEEGKYKYRKHEKIGKEKRKEEKKWYNKRWRRYRIRCFGSI